MRAATDIEGRTELVTGAASGIGLATARRLAAAGARTGAAPGAWALTGSVFAMDAGRLAH